MCRQSLGATNKALSKFHILAKELSRQCRFLALRNQHGANMSQVISLGVLFLDRKQTKVIIITATANVVGASWPEEEIRRIFEPCFKSRRNKATMIIIT